MPKVLTGLKFLMASISLGGSIWFWSLFADKALSDLKKDGASNNEGQLAIPVVQPLVVEITPTSSPIMKPTPTLRSVNIGTVNTSVQQPVIQTIIVDTGSTSGGSSSSNSSSAPAPVTNTRSS